MQHFKARKRAYAFVGLAGAVGLVASSFGVAGAQTPVEKKTLAAVGGSGAGNVLVECAWALPDMSQPNSGANGAPSSAAQMNYGVLTSPAPGFLDDDDDARLAPTPCTSTPGTEARPTQANTPTAPTLPQIDVTPNLDDKVAGANHLRWIELWAAVDGAGEQNPNAVVNWQVFHPDGSFKVQVDGTNYTSSDTVAQCSGPAGMFTSAVETGQIQATTVTNTTTQHDSLRDYCLNAEKDLYYGSFGLSKHQPYGMYKVVANVVNGSNVSSLTYFINVKPIVGFAQDFTDVDFGAVSASQVKNISGNTTWDISGPVSPISLNRPSVQSTGNTAITVEMAYQNMCYQVIANTPDCGPAKEITWFDGKLGSAINTVESREVQNLPSAASNTPLTGDYMNFVAATTTDPGSERFRTLCPNDVFKIDFSLHAPASLLPGNYQGKTFLKVVAFGGTASPGGLAPVACPTDQGHVYYPFNTAFNTYQNAVAVTVDTIFNGTTPKTTGYQV